MVFFCLPPLWLQIDVKMTWIKYFKFFITKRVVLLICRKRNMNNSVQICFFFFTLSRYNMSVMMYAMVLYALAHAYSIASCVQWQGAIDTPHTSILCLRETLYSIVKLLPSWAIYCLCWGFIHFLWQERSICEKSKCYSAQHARLIHITNSFVSLLSLSVYHSPKSMCL